MHAIITTFYFSYLPCLFFFWYWYPIPLLVLLDRDRTSPRSEKRTGARSPRSHAREGPGVLHSLGSRVRRALGLHSFHAARRPRAGYRERGIVGVLRGSAPLVSCEAPRTRAGLAARWYFDCRSTFGAGRAVDES